ncbi:hypothetical protein AeMF1_015655 [Aphanomyces euteiches]|nr:hypothetical protein AeMF1_015655 [Aphanomyces euteiches]
MTPQVWNTKEIIGNGIEIDLELEENDKLPPLIDVNGEEITGEKFSFTPVGIGIVDEELSEHSNISSPKVRIKSDVTSEIIGPLEPTYIESTEDIGVMDEEVKNFQVGVSNAVGFDPAVTVRNHEPVERKLKAIGNEVEVPSRILKTGPAPNLETKESEAVMLDTSYVAAVVSSDENYEEVGTHELEEPTISQVVGGRNDRLRTMTNETIVVGEDEEQVEGPSEENSEAELNAERSGYKSVIKPRMLGRNGKSKHEKAHNGDDEVELKPVFSDEQLEAIRQGDFSGIEENHFVEIEDRLYPISKKAIIDQVSKIRAERKDPTNQEIMNELSAILGRNVKAEDAGELGREHDLDDPDRWSSWYEETLKMCSEAPRANRNFSNYSKGTVAMVSSEMQIGVARRNLFRLQELTPKNG